MSGTEGVQNNKPIKGAYEAVTGKEPKTQGLKDVLDTNGVFDVAKEANIPTGGVKDVVEDATGIPMGGAKDIIEDATGVPMGGAVDVVEKATGRDLSPNKGLLEVITGKELPKMGLVDVIDKYGKGVYQTVRNWFSK